MAGEKYPAPTPSILPDAITTIFWQTLRDVHTLYSNAEPLRQAFLKQVTAHQVPFTDNLRYPDLWITYPFFTSMIRKLYTLSELTVLDWGGLYGHVTTLLKKTGYRQVHNYLLNIPTSYDIFQQTFHLETRYGKDPNHLALPDASYDVVISSGVLEHVREDGKGEEARILREINRVLKPYGTFWIWYLPNRYSLSETLSRLTGRWHHRYCYGKRQIVTTLRREGFDILFFSRHSFLPGTLKRLISPWFPVTSLFKIDTHLANLPLLRVLASNFLIIAQKR